MLHSDQCRKTRPREEATGNKIPEASNARGQDVEPRTESKIALFYTIISLLILLTLEILPKLATRGFKTTNLKKPPRDSEGN